MGGEGTIRIGLLLKATVSDAPLTYSPIATSYGSLDAEKVTKVTATSNISYDAEKDLYTLGAASVAITVTYDGTDYSRTHNASIFAPIEYEYISGTDNTYMALMGIIPLMLIIVAVLYAVRLMGGSRN